MSNPKVLVLMGGPDAEREVSIRSGTRVAEALVRAGGWEVESRLIGRITNEDLAQMQFDVAFPVLHGPWGEGGPLQEILEAEGRPFVGCRSKSARLAMDKAASKMYAQRIGVRTPPSRIVTSPADLDLEPPFVLKPVDDGSSVDMRICHDQVTGHQACLELLKGRPRLLAERFIKGREITVGILHRQVLPIIEIVPSVDFYDYEAKYNRDDTKYLFDSDIDPEHTAAASAWALQVFDAIGCRDIARVDFMVDERGPWFLEINTMPGMTDHSLIPKAASHVGISFEEVCASLATAGLARRARDRGLADISPSPALRAE
ncbi:MAG: D-alanine--D-alanine ligase [Phycisphaerales bacterium]|nr:D-alanine--D-alanine ligase [Phycisphaerales bacterium]